MRGERKSLAEQLNGVRDKLPSHEDQELLRKRRTPRNPVEVKQQAREDLDV
jgi:hypothetical protein